MLLLFFLQPDLWCPPPPLSIYGPPPSSSFLQTDGRWVGEGCRGWAEQEEDEEEGASVAAGRKSPLTAFEKREEGGRSKEIGQTAVTRHIIFSHFKISRIIISILLGFAFVFGKFRTPCAGLQGRKEPSFPFLLSSSPLLFLHGWSPSTTKGPKESQRDFASSLLPLAAAAVSSIDDGGGGGGKKVDDLTYVRT